MQSTHQTPMTSMSPKKVSSPPFLANPRRSPVLWLFSVPRVSCPRSWIRIIRLLQHMISRFSPSLPSRTELNEWSNNLPAHLKLTFVQDKPSTDVTGSRSALLVSFDIILADCKFAHCDKVSCLLLHSHSHPLACCWLDSW